MNSQSFWEEGRPGYWAGHHPTQWLLLQAACSTHHHFRWPALSPVPVAGFEPLILLL
jgi:hypothetical protein